MRARTPRTLVTGAGVRLGAALARALATRGCPVLLHAHRHTADAEALAREIRTQGGEARVVTADLAEPEAGPELARQAEADFGPIEALVLSASIFERAPIESVREADLERTLRVNLVAPFGLARALGLAMRSRGGGSIVTMLDWSSNRPRADYLPYEISKAALAAATRGLAKCLAPQVRVNGVALGAVLLPDDVSAQMEEAVVAATPLGRLGTPEDAVGAALYLLLDAEFATGAIWTLDGGRSLR